MENGGSFHHPMAWNPLKRQEGATEVQRRAAEWERQIEHLDAKVSSMAMPWESYGNPMENDEKS